jgi:hypothetical protein
LLSFGGAIKPSAPCHKILRHVKMTYKYQQRYFEDKIHNFLRLVLPDFRLDDSAGRNAIELWLTNQEFSLADIIPPWFSMLIYHLGDEQ